MAGQNTAGLNASNDAQTGDLSHLENQLTLSEKPRRYTFRIVADKSLVGAIYGVMQRSMPELSSKGIVDKLTLTINPQTYRLMEPTRQGTTQTVSGAWVDWYGLGLPKLSIAGTTGWNPNRMRSSTNSQFAFLNAANQERMERFQQLRAGKGAANPNAPTGLQDFIYLRNRIFRTYAILLQKLNLKFDKRIQDQLQLQFFAWDTEDYCVILIDQFELQRSVARPLLYDYNLQATVIGYVGDRAGALSDYLDKMNEPKARLGAILTALKKWSAFAKKWATIVGNVSTGLGKAISAVTSQVDALSKNIEQVLADTTSFITTPLKAVQSLTTDVRNLANSVLSIAQLPERFKNELHNQLLETWCAVSGLTAYPGLFKDSFKAISDGAPWANLNCSSTLGIPPNPTTNDPGESLPSSNTPPNSFNDLRNPQAPVSSFRVSASTSPYRISEVTVMEGDTVESTLFKLGGLDQNIAQVWQQIATLNDLEYPYIVPDVNFQTEVRATTTIVISGTPSTVIPSGSRVGTQAISSNEDIVIFRTVSSATIGVDGNASVLVMAEKPGDFANVSPLAIYQFIDATGQPTTLAGVNSIENQNAAVGGKIYKVLKPGQKLRVPVALDAGRESGYVERSDSVDVNLFKSDIALDADGDILADGFGDIQIVSGIENMSAAIQDRLRTDKGELIKHPGYGLNLPQMVGEPGDQNFVDFAKLELQTTLLQDPRVKKVDNLTLVKNTDALRMDMNLILIDEKSRPTSASLPV